MTTMAMSTSTACLPVVQPPLPLGAAGALDWQLCQVSFADTLANSKLPATHLLQYRATLDAQPDSMQEK